MQSIWNRGNIVGWFGLKDQGSGNVMIMEINEKTVFKYTDICLASKSIPCGKTGSCRTKSHLSLCFLLFSFLTLLPA